MISAVEAVLIIEKLTFFSENDLWQYDAQADDRLCDRCEYYLHLNGGLYQGDEILTLFPYMEVTSDDEIAVNLHPNCRCFLFRIPVKKGNGND